jgi:hypothetical protein
VLTLPLLGSPFSAPLGSSASFPVAAAPSPSAMEQQSAVAGGEWAAAMWTCRSCVRVQLRADGRETMESDRDGIGWADRAKATAVANRNADGMDAATQIPNPIRILVDFLHGAYSIRTRKKGKEILASYHDWFVLLGG